jgi:hypothetical protein
MRIKKARLFKGLRLWNIKEKLESSLKSMTELICLRCKFDINIKIY